jgi:protein MAK11
MLKIIFVQKANLYDGRRLGQCSSFSTKEISTSTQRWDTVISFDYPCLTLHQELAALYTLEHASRIHDVKFVQRVDGEGEVLLVAAEDKKTTVYEVHSDIHTIMHPVAYLVGHKNRCVVENALTLSHSKKSCRVKAIDTIRVALPSTRRNSTTILSSVCSDGTINVYDLSLLPPPAPIAPSSIPEISPVVTYDSKGTRLTCVTLAEGEVDHAEQPSPDKVVKRKRESDSEEDEDEEEEWQGFSS